MENKTSEALEKINKYVKIRDIQALAVQSQNTLSRLIELGVDKENWDEFKPIIAVRDNLSKFIWSSDMITSWNEIKDALHELSKSVESTDTFKQGAEAQKKKDQELIKKLNGMQPWIGDEAMKRLFTETLNKLLEN